MPMLVTTYNPTGILRMIAATGKLKSGANVTRTLSQGVRKAGNKVRTIVRRELKAQTGAKRYGTIVKATRSFIPAPAVYVIEGTGKGLPITEFGPKASAKIDSRRFSRRQHWMFQPRVGGGRFGKMPPLPNGGVTATPWNVAHAFKRSYQDEAGVFRARLPGQKSGKGRKLYGPAIWKEIVKDQTAAAFQSQGPRFLDEEVGRELRRLLP